MLMTTSTAESHLPLHPLEFEILLTLKPGTTHAYSVVQAIEARQPAWSRIQPTNMYRRIWRLEASGLLEAVEAPADETDTRRKYFAITPLGELVAAAEASRLKSLLRTAQEAGVLAEETS